MNNTKFLGIIKGKRIYLLCFLFSILVSCLDLNRTFEMKLVSDNVGSLALPAVLAGRDWSGLLIDGIKYYGWGYYILFTPVFVLTHNPITIYTIVCVVNMIVLGLISVLIFHVSVKFLGLSSSLYTVFLAIISSLYVTYYAWNFTAELPSLLVVWVTAWLLLKAYSATRKKTLICYSICLALLITYSYNIHTRLIVLLPAVVTACLLFYIAYRKWCIHFPAFLGSSVCGFLIARALKAKVISSLWKVTSMDELRNATTNVASYVDRFKGTFKVVLDVWISNLFKLNLDTYGFMMICIIVIIPFLGLRLLRKNNDVEVEKQSISEKAFILICVYGAALAATIAMLPLYYASSIAAGYNEGIENAQFSGLTYIRYYFIYYGPVFVAVVTLLYKKIVSLTWKKIILGLAGSLLLAVYVSIWVMKHIIFGFSRFYYTEYVKQPYWNLWISVLIILLAFLGVFGLIKYDKMNMILGILFLVKIMELCNIEQNAFYDIIPHNSGNASYAVISEAEKAYSMPDHFYSLDSRGVQFMLNWKKMVYGNLPDESDEEAIVISKSKYSERTEELLQLGYQCFVLDGNECMWLKSEKLLEELTPIINLYKEGTFSLKGNKINYGFIKFREYVFADEDGFIGVFMECPADGRYTFYIDMSAAGEHAMKIGRVEIKADDLVIQSGNLIYKKEDKAVGAVVTVDMECVENLEVDVFFNEDVIIKDFKVNYVWSDE